MVEWVLVGEGIGFDSNGGSIVDFCFFDEFIDLFFGIMWDVREGDSYDL